ncbi:MAG: hypothetical protein I8H75_00865 [Myxococcaceae bacterium]|nr:hypothetical protein [Myxococcaceae bacterium]MBH2005892.1 hypothetical protein [Myxococcaceae bacterium]
MKLFLWAIVGVSCLGRAEPKPNFPCDLPMLRFSLSSVSEQALPEPAIPAVVTTVTQNGGAVSSVVSAITAVGPTQVAQTARSGLSLDLLACDDGLPMQEGPLDWADSPTQLSLGEGSLQYHTGAVLGNWVLMVGAVGVWSGVAYKLGPEAAQFPGSLILPALLLIVPTVTSSFTLARDGDKSLQTAGSVSILVSLASIAAVGVKVCPRFFKARWEDYEHEWVDLSNAQRGWVARYGELFDTYAAGRQGYIVVELLTSVGVGTLKSYQILEQNCQELLWAGMVVYDAYAISQLALRPNRNRHAQIFYSAIATLQATALTLQAIVSVSASEETQSKVKTVTQSVVVVTEYMMMIKTLFDMGLRVKSWYDRYYRLHSVSLPKQSAGLSTPQQNTPLEEMLSVAFVPPSQDTLVGEMLPLACVPLSLDSLEPIVPEALSPSASVSGEENLKATLVSDFGFLVEQSSSVAPVPKSLNEVIAELMQQESDLE